MSPAPCVYVCVRVCVGGGGRTCGAVFGVREQLLRCRLRADLKQAAGSSLNSLIHPPTHSPTLYIYIYIKVSVVASTPSQPLPRPSSMAFPPSRHQLSCGAQPAPAAVQVYSKASSAAHSEAEIIDCVKIKRGYRPGTQVTSCTASDSFPALCSPSCAPAKETGLMGS